MQLLLSCLFLLCCMFPVNVMSAETLADTGNAIDVYSLTDLVGNWEIQSLAAGPGAPWWGRGPITIAENGSFSGNFVESDGNTDPISGTFAITTAGVVSMNPSNPDFSCNLNANKMIMACTETWSSWLPGTVNMPLMIKKGTAYAQSDLTGTWDLHQLATVGAHWLRATLVVSAGGSFTGDYNSDNRQSGSFSGALTIAANGEVTQSNSLMSEPDVSEFCQLDAGKTIIICTSSDRTHGESLVSVYLKKTTGYTQSDLAGTWDSNGLASGTEYLWSRGTITVGGDASYSGTVQQSTGSSHAVSGTFGITSDGIVTPPDAANNQCSLDASKTVMACTRDWTTEHLTSEMTIYTKNATGSSAPVDGACGTSNGGYFATAPSTDLCSSGTPSNVAGDGPWNWTCQGANGGTDAFCSAEKLVDPVQINDGAAFTSSTTVTLTLHAPTGKGFVRVSNDGSSWGKWLAVTPTLSWKLTAVNGERTVSVQFAAVNNATTGETFSDSIMLDTKPPGCTIQVNGGMRFTNSRATSVVVALKLPDTADDIDGICIGEDKTCTSFTPFAASQLFTLSAGDGKKNVYVILKDRAGNKSKPVKGMVTLDTVAPTGTLTINGGNSETINPEVSLKMTASGASEMQICLDGLTWGSWEKFTAGKKVTLPGGYGEKWVSVKFRDLAGNESAAVSAGITLILYQPTSCGEKKKMIVGQWYQYQGIAESFFPVHLGIDSGGHFDIYQQDGSTSRYLYALDTECSSIMLIKETGQLYRTYNFSISSNGLQLTIWNDSQYYCKGAVGVCSPL